MPTYEYECPECGKQFEVFHKMTDKLQKKCPDCGGKAKKLISAGCGLIFKGSGFYITDYKKKNVSCAGESKACEKTECKSCEAKNSDIVKKTDKNNKSKKD